VGRHSAETGPPHGNGQIALLVPSDDFGLLRHPHGRRQVVGHVRVQAPLRRFETRAHRGPQPVLGVVIGLAGSEPPLIPRGGSGSLLELRDRLHDARVVLGEQVELDPL